jgi:hypothetical protein
MNNFTPAELHPDLKPYVRGDDLCHPLVQIEGIFPILYKRVNLVYEYKLRQISHPEPPNEWSAYLPNLSVFDRQIKFITNEYNRQDPEYFRIVGQIWTDPDILGCTSSFLELFLHIEPFRSNDKPDPNVIQMMTKIEQEKLVNLPEELIVYRGHHPRLVNGMSWTLDRNVAMQYAVGRDEQRMISTGTVSKTDVIAFIDRWHEDEILVHTKYVRDIETQIAIT